MSPNVDPDVVPFPARRPGEPCPPPEYAEFRSRGCPVRTRMPGGQPAWLVSRYEDVRAVLADPAVSANPSNPGFPRVADTGGVPRQDQIPGWFVGLDLPEHRRYRRAFIPEFSVRRVRQWRPTIEEVVDECIDDLLTHAGNADLVRAFAVAVPSRIIATILGVSLSDRGFYESRTQTLMNLAGTTDAQRTEATQQLLRHISRLIAIKRSWPGDDLISRVLATGVLEPRELAGAVMLLLIAGHETTANNIALGVLTLLTHPEWAGDDRVVDETIRLHSVGDLLAMRTVVEDVEIGGHTMRAGEGIIPLIAAANHDNSLYDDPGAFRPDRTTPGHVGFDYGVHQCLGQNLVRAEMECAYRQLFARIPTLRLACAGATGLQVRRDRVRPTRPAGHLVTPLERQTMHITVDTGRCIGAGQCVLAAPAVFDQDDDAVVMLLDGSPGPGDLARARSAVDRCPSGALAVADAPARDDRR